MKNENLYSRMGFVCSEIDRIDKENPTEPNEPTDPRIVELIAEGRRIQNEMDPLMRETLRDRPEELAEWDEIMHMCDGTEKS
jgi:hypothetical protein